MKSLLKTVGKVILGLTLALVTLVGGDFAVRILTQKKEPLSDEQVEKAKATYGNAIDYSKVRIAFGRISYFEPPGTVVTLGNTIYYPPENNPEKTQSTSKADTVAAPIITIGYQQPKTAKERDRFTHEMGHVWQNQNDIKNTGISGAFTLWARGFFLSDTTNVYAYTPDKNKNLTTYNMEQQAMIFEDYAVMKKNILKHPKRAVPAEYAALKKIVRTAIPPKAKP